jgi:hypothetical protein
MLSRDSGLGFVFFLISHVICPQIIPTAKKKTELETLEIIMVVNTSQSVVCLISDNYDKQK